MENALGRILMTLIAGKEAAHPRAFFEERYVGGDPTQAPQKFFSLHRNGEYPDWEFVADTMKSAGIKKADPVWKAAEVLWETGGDMEAAILAARETLNKKQLEVHPAHVPGFTMEELNSVRTEKKKGNGGRKKAAARKTDSVNDLL